MSQIWALGVQPCPLSLASHCFVVLKPPGCDSASAQPPQCHWFWGLVRWVASVIPVSGAQKIQKGAVISPPRWQIPLSPSILQKEGRPAFPITRADFGKSSSFHLVQPSFLGLCWVTKKMNLLVVTADSVSRQIRETESGFKPRPQLHVH